MAFRCRWACCDINHAPSVNRAIRILSRMKCVGVQKVGGPSSLVERTRRKRTTVARSVVAAKKTIPPINTSHCRRRRAVRTTEIFLITCQPVRDMVWRASRDPYSSISPPQQKLPRSLLLPRLQLHIVVINRPEIVVVMRIAEHEEVRNPRAGLIHQPHRDRPDIRLLPTPLEVARHRQHKRRFIALDAS